MLSACFDDDDKIADILMLTLVLSRDSIYIRVSHQAGFDAMSFL